MHHAREGRSGSDASTDASNDASSGATAARVAVAPERPAAAGHAAAAPARAGLAAPRNGDGDAAPRPWRFPTDPPAV
jgi:hypothetical protein